MLLENLASYISLLKLHIYIEDQIFFRMVEKELSEDEDRMLLEQFKHEEKRVGTEDFFENSRKLVHEISSIIKTFLLWFKPLLNYQGRPDQHGDNRYAHSQNTERNTDLHPTWYIIGHLPHG